MAAPGGEWQSLDAASGVWDQQFFPIPQSSFGFPGSLPASEWSTSAMQSRRPSLLTQQVQSLPSRLLLFWGWRFCRGILRGPRNHEGGERADIMAGLHRQIYCTSEDI